MTIAWAGLSVGALYTIIALTYNVTLVYSGVFNFAQAQLVTAAVFAAYVGASIWHLPTPVIVLGGAIVVGLIAVLEEQLAVRPLMGSAEGMHSTLVTTIGAAVLIEGVIVVIFGPDATGIPFPGGDQPITLLSGRVAPVDLTLIILSLVLGLGLHVLSRRTRLGLMARAAAEDRDAAAIRGVNVRSLTTLGFAAGGFVAGLLGLVIGAKTFAYFNLGDGLVIYGFVALAIGGFGSYLGSIVGGMTLGLLQAVAARYVGPDYPPLMIVGVLLLVLLTKPTGLFGARTIRSV